jgi:serine/threonine-protein phosphatase 4 regulatory subunit 4
MELLSDAVPNVRLAALSLLPALKQTIRLPEDVQQLVSRCMDCHQQFHVQL